MSLLTDSNAIPIEDLEAEYPQIRSVAANEGIDIPAAVQSALRRVRRVLLDRLPDALSLNTMDGDESLLQHVTLTEELRAWCVAEALWQVFFFASQNSDNARYRQLSAHFRSQAIDSRSLLFTRGVGWVASPVPEGPLPIASPGTGTTHSGPIFVSAAYCDENGEEGLPGAVVYLDRRQTLPYILTIPNGAPAELSWNVYAGFAADSLFRQNPLPISAAASWSEPQQIVTGGVIAGGGQSADYFIRLPNLIRRS